MATKRTAEQLKQQREYQAKYRQTENGKAMRKKHRIEEYKKRDALPGPSNINQYGLTQDDYAKMFEEQNGYCKICKGHAIEFSRRLAVDHCHETGKVRGLLCMFCNTGLGNFKDNIDLLEEAIAYLKNAAS